MYWIAISLISPIESVHDQVHEVEASVEARTLGEASAWIQERRRAYPDWECQWSMVVGDSQFREGTAPPFDDDSTAPF